MTTGQLEWLPCFLFVYTHILVPYQFDRNLGKTIVGFKTDLKQTTLF